MNLPKKIEVLNRTYKVMEKDMGGAEHIGISKFVDGTIAIDAGLDSQAMADTLLHEIIHLILIAMGHEMGKNETLHTEQNVLVISNGLATFLRDNPKTFKDIIDNLN